MIAEHLKADASGLTALFIFSFGILLVALIPDVPPMQYGFIGMSFGFFALSSYQKLSGKQWKKEWKAPPALYILSILGIGLYNMLLFISLRHAPVFEINILNYLWPLFLIIFSSFYDHKNIKLLSILGIFCGLAGCIFVFWPQAGQSFFNTILPAHVVTIFAALLWAGYSTISKRYSYKVGVMAPIFGLSALLFLTGHLIFEETIMPSIFAWSVLIIYGLCRFAYVFWDFGIRHGDRQFLSSMSYLVPLFSSALLIFFGFKPSSMMVAIGGGLIVTGCLIVNADKLRKLFKKNDTTL